MKNKRRRAVIIAIVAIIICAVLVIGLVAPIGLHKQGNNSAIAGSVSEEEMDNSEEEAAEASSGEETVSSDPESVEGKGSGFFGSLGLIGSIFGNGKGTSGSAGSDEKKSSEDSNGTQTDVSNPTLSEISFPYTVSGTDIVVEQISPYNGYFIEDGQDQEASNVAAIVLTNKGDDADFVGVGISQGNRSLAFSASQIPAGASVIVLEQNKASYESDPYFSCTATVTRTDDFNLNEDRIKINQEDDGTFTVYNISDETIPQVKVLFKSYIPEENIYVGGITYTVTVSDLEPGMGENISTSHYDPTYSRFIEAVIEEDN